MDVDLCRRIQCGAVSQAQAGLDTLLECSQSGMVGVKGCGDPDCSPYLDEMRASGVCPPADGAVVVPASAAPTALPLLAAAFPSITPRAPVPAPSEPYREPWYCPINRWAVHNRLGAALVLVGVYLLVKGFGDRGKGAA